MADSASSGKVTNNNETSSPNNSPHLAFTTISNIELHIPVQLSLSEPNYKKWSRLFRLLILRFNLKGFIDGTTIASSADDAEWYQFDALIQGWILSTITDEVSDLVLANNLSAHAPWKAIYNLFHDNKHARAMQLEHRFRTTVKGQLSIDEYCRLLKNLSEYLDDVDAPVTEHALVLQVLQGLPHDIRGQVQFLQYQNPLPMFLEVRSALLLVEQQHNDAVYAAGAPSTSLLSTGGGDNYAGSGHRQDRGSGYGGSGSSGSGGGHGGGSGGRGRNFGSGSGGGNRARGKDFERFRAPRTKEARKREIKKRSDEHELSLGGRGKSIFLSPGGIPQPTDEHELSAWSANNQIICSWIFNSVDESIQPSIVSHTVASVLWKDLKKRYSCSNGPRVYQLKSELNSLRQKDQTVVSYYNQFITLWNQLTGTSDPTNGCKCEAAALTRARIERDKTIDFLLGLDDEQFGSIQSQILGTEPVVDIDRAYYLVSQEERHRHIVRARDYRTDSLAFAAKSDRRPYSRGGGTRGGATCGGRGAGQPVGRGGRGPSGGPGSGTAMSGRGSGSATVPAASVHAASGDTNGALSDQMSRLMSMLEASASHTYSGIYTRVPGPT
ncbi:unnamed protein product [Cuscuta campestris]|uniref:Uncharacterized protein n=1 Tax=Cuscuta campestris TaxID=132261 RepID=A0A484LKY9_9ASTE|nr:unnamed protein product [Cuscuta campestris]